VKLSLVVDQAGAVD